MALPVREQAKYWGIALAVLFGFIWLLSDIILPFILSMAIAYLLDPIADRLEKMGLSRVLATVVITIGAGIFFTLASLLVIPTLFRQMGELISTAPDLFEKLQTFVETRFPDVFVEGSQLQTTLLEIGETIKSHGAALLQTALSSVMSLFNVLMIIFLVPVITFYLLVDWDRMTAKAEKLLPRDHAPAIKDLILQIDRTLAAFIRGQGTVCLILGIFYAIALMSVGLNFGLVAGVVAGALTFIPYVGALVGGALSIGLAFFQFWGGSEVVDGETLLIATDWARILLVAGIFAFGQFFEGNILTPKLVGTSIGLHPVWLIFSLAAFGTLFGFVGMLIAVPIAASIGVCVIFAIDQYKQSRLYRGLEALENPDDQETSLSD